MTEQAFLSERHHDAIFRDEHLIINELYKQPSKRAIYVFYQSTRYEESFSLIYLYGYITGSPQKNFFFCLVVGALLRRARNEHYLFHWTKRSDVLTSQRYDHGWFLLIQRYSNL